MLRKMDRTRKAGHTFLPDTETVSIEPYLSSLTLLSLIGLFPIYFPSFSFHARRKSSGSENAINPYFAYGVSAQVTATERDRGAGIRRRQEASQK